MLIRNFMLSKLCSETPFNSFRVQPQPYIVNLNKTSDAKFDRPKSDNVLLDASWSWLANTRKIHSRQTINVIVIHSELQPLISESHLLLERGAWISPRHVKRHNYFFTRVGQYVLLLLKFSSWQWNNQCFCGHDARLITWCFVTRGIVIWLRLKNAHFLEIFE